MADWYGHARSNYFTVKDPEAFKTAMATIEVAVEPGRSSMGQQTDGMFALFGEDQYGGWPSSTYDEDTDEWTDFDIADLVAEHLADGAVAVFMECGAEKLRYITGFAVAINNKGERRTLQLSSIYDLAKELGPNITEASY